MTGPQRREQLLDVAKALAVEHGFHTVTIEAIAREAGITRPVVYGHFGDLAGLLEALVERESARALGQLAEILPASLDAGSARDQLLRAYAGYLRAAETDPATWTLVLMPQEGAPEIMREQISRGREAVVTALARALAPGASAGTPDPELTARMLSALADESVRLLLTDPGRYPVARHVRLASWFLERLDP